MTTLLEQILQDLRCGWRVHCASGKSTAVIVLTLGVAIATASTVFGFVDAVLLRPPTVPHPEGLMVITDTSDVTGRPRLFSFSDVADLSEALRGSMDVTALTTVDLLLGREHPVLSRGFLVGANYFDVMQVRAKLGRGLSAADDADNRDVVVISDAFRRRYFGSSPNILGQHLEFGVREFIVVGVMPDDFTGTQAGFFPDFWMSIQR